LGLREENAKRARAALLTAARQEFGEHGFEDASLRRIASSAGVATGTLFNYFSSKLELLHQALYLDLEDTCERALLVSETLALADQLVAMARVFLDMFSQQPQLYRVLLKESLFATGASGEAFKAQVARFAEDVTRRIATSDVASPEVATLGFISAYYFALITCLAAESPDVERSLYLLRLQLGPILRGPQ